MSNEPETATDLDTLNGWREIADYLGKSVRSAQRWEALVGLPVQRATGPDGSSVVTASRRAIDAWRATMTSLPPGAESELASETGDGGEGPGVPAVAVEGEPRHPSVSPWRRLRTWGLVLVAGLAAGAAGAVAFVPAAVRPTRFAVEGARVVAFGGDGARVWTHALETAGRWPDGALPVLSQGDLDGDGVAEVAMGVTYAHPEAKSLESDAVLLFGRDGRLWWTIQPDSITDPVSPGEDDGAGPWRLRSISFAAAPPWRVWLAYGHDDPGRSSFVLEVSPEGRSVVRYVQSGRISRIKSWHTTSGHYLVVGGTEVSTSQASLVVVPPSQPVTRWTDDRPPLPGATPAAVFRLPTSDLRDVLPRRYVYVSRMIAVADHMRVETDEGVPSSMLAWLGADLRLHNIGRPSGYWALHRRLEAQGKVDHNPSTCPDSLATTIVRAWRPASGWTDEVVRVLPNLPGLPIASSPHASGALPQ